MKLEGHGQGHGGRNKRDGRDQRDHRDHRDHRSTNTNGTKSLYVQQLKGHIGKVFSVKAIPTVNAGAVSGGEDMMVRLWDLERGTLLVVSRSHLLLHLLALLAMVLFQFQFQFQFLIFLF